MPALPTVQTFPKKHKSPTKQHKSGAGRKLSDLERILSAQHQMLAGGQSIQGSFMDAKTVTPLPGLYMEKIPGVHVESYVNRPPAVSAAAPHSPMFPLHPHTAPTPTTPTTQQQQLQQFQQYHHNPHSHPHQRPQQQQQFQPYPQQHSTLISMLQQPLPAVTPTQPHLQQQNYSHQAPPAVLNHHYGSHQPPLHVQYHQPHQHLQSQQIRPSQSLLSHHQPLIQPQVQQQQLSKPHNAKEQKAQDLVPFSRSNRLIRTEVQVMKDGAVWRPPYLLDSFLVPAAEWVASASVNLGDAAMLIKVRCGLLFFAWEPLSIPIHSHPFFLSNILKKYLFPKGRGNRLQCWAQEVVQAAVPKHPHDEGREAGGRVAPEQVRPLQVRRHRGLGHRRHDFAGREHQGDDSRPLEEGLPPHHSSEPAQHVKVVRESTLDKQTIVSFCAAPSNKD